MAILSKFTISCSGDVGHKPEQLKKWVENNGGKWLPRPTKGITHLICSKEHWKRNVDSVQTALKAGAHIVSYDWLEDSLQGRRKLAEKKYTWAAILKERKQTKKFKRMGKDFDTLKFKKGCDLARDETGSGTSPVSPKPSSRARGGFFVSAMEDLKQKREARLAREAEEKMQKTISADMAASPTPSSPQQESVSSTTFLPTPPASSYATPPVNSKSSPSSSPPPVHQPTTEAQIPTPVRSSTPKPKGKATAKVPPPTEKFTENYHIYLDRTGFEYSLKLLRTNLRENSFAQYQLRLYESNTTPHTYATFIRYAPAARPSAPGVEVPGVPSQSQSPSSPSVQPQASEEDKEMHPLHVRAMSLMQHLSTPTPSPIDRPFRSLLSPLNSDFQTAFGTFRAAFQEVTLLAWEERLDSPNRELQKQRAVEWGLEPFVWKRPDVGLGVGDMPALPGVAGPQMKKAGGKGEDSCMVLDFALPATRVPLSPTSGTLGSSMHRDAVQLQKKADEKKRREEEKKKEVLGKKKAASKGTQKRKNGPFFNGVNGTSYQDWRSDTNSRSGSFGALRAYAHTNYANKLATGFKE